MYIDEIFHTFLGYNVIIISIVLPYKDDEGKGFFASKYHPKTITFWLPGNIG